MAEIQINYRELQKEIEESIEEFNNITRKANPNIPNLPEDFGVAIMYCLTGEVRYFNEARENLEEKDSYSNKTWENLEEKDSYFNKTWENSKKLWYDRSLPLAAVPIGNNNIKLQDVLLEILKVLIEKGVAALLFPNELYKITPKELVRIVSELLSSVNSLNNYDRCLAYKVVENPSTIYKSIDKKCIIKWFPGIDDCSKNCNMTHVDMHYSCKFFNFEDNLCTITEEKIIDALNSLEEKGIVNPTNNDTSYKFKW